MFKVAFMHHSPFANDYIRLFRWQDNIRNFKVAALHYLRILYFIKLSLPAKTGSFQCVLINSADKTVIDFNISRWFSVGINSFLVNYNFINQFIEKRCGKLIDF